MAGHLSRCRSHRDVLYSMKNIHGGGFAVEDNVLEVKMLGGFTLRRGEISLEVSGRSRKLYLLLACLIRERARGIPYEELGGLLWPGAGLDAGALNALKALLHRARRFLDALGAGACLLNRDGCCRWDPAVPLTLDAEEFCRLCQAGGEDEAHRTALWTQALGLYQGDLLPAAGDCPWAAEQAKALHALWLDTALRTLPLLAQEGQWDRAAALSGDALRLEPCHEGLCRRHMEALLHLERRKEAVRAYQSLQEELLAQKGVLPSDDLRELCRAARNDPDPRTITPTDLPQRLREPPSGGALLCDFDFFRTLCFSLVRMAQRSGQALHAALLTLAGEEDAPLPRHSRDRAMDNLQEVILNELRRGDAAARCSAAQFVLLLPQAGYEDAQKACRRVCRAFTRQFPHSPARLSFAVLPLTGPTFSREKK